MGSTSLPIIYFNQTPQGVPKAIPPNQVGSSYAHPAASRNPSLQAGEGNVLKRPRRAQLTVALRRIAVVKWGTYYKSPEKRLQDLGEPGGSGRKPK